MPTLFDETWTDDAGDTVSASDLNSHAAEHSSDLITVQAGGTAVSGVGRDKPVEFAGSGVSVTDDTTNGKVVVDVTDTDTDTRVETQAGGTTQYADTSVIDFDTSSDISVTDNGSGQITVAASGGGGGSVNSIDPQSVSDAPDSTGNRSVCIGPEGPTDNGVNRSVVIGPFASIDSAAISKGIAIGNAAIGGDESVAIGAGAEASEESVGIGKGALAFANNSIVLSSYNYFNTVVNTQGIARMSPNQLVFGASSGGTIANADLNNQELTVQANSAEDGLVFRYKTSGGTVKTGTVSLS